MAPGCYRTSSSLQSEAIRHGHWFDFSFSMWEVFSFNWSAVKEPESGSTNESVVLSLLTASRGDLLSRWLHCDQVPLWWYNQQERISRPLHQHQVPGYTALTQVTSGGRKGPRGAKGQTERPPGEAPAWRSETFGHQDESDTTEQPQDHQPHLSS